MLFVELISFFHSNDETCLFNQHYHTMCHIFVMIIVSYFLLQLYNEFGISPIPIDSGYADFHFSATYQ